MPRLFEMFCVSTDKFSRPSCCAEAVNHTFGLWPEAQFGCLRGGVMVTTFPLIAVATATSICQRLFNTVPRLPFGPLSSHPFVPSQVAAQTKYPPLSMGAPTEEL